jgi:hypothetical protein
MESLSKDKLISFLQNLIIKVEQDNLSTRQHHAICEFYTCYKFKERKKEITISNEDYLKFLTLGWYIYSQMESPLL